MKKDELGIKGEKDLISMKVWEDVNLHVNVKTTTYKKEAKQKFIGQIGKE